MFKIGEIKMSELAGTAFPELAGREGLLYGVSDPEAPESNSMIYVRTEVADSYTKVRDSIFVTKEEVELPGLHESCVHPSRSVCTVYCWKPIKSCSRKQSWYRRMEAISVLM